MIEWWWLLVEAVVIVFALLLAQGMVFLKGMKFALKDPAKARQYISGTYFET